MLLSTAYYQGKQANSHGDSIMTNPYPNGSFKFIEWNKGWDNAEIDRHQQEDEDIDKCMNCGRYKASSTLTYPDQVCRKGCVNPNEY
jgi:hypothetical protein